MKTILLVAQREILENRKYFLVALFASIIPLLAPIFPGVPQGDREAARGVVAAAVALCFAGGLSVALGTSLIGTPLKERRLGFYFSLPIRPPWLWAGKMLGGWLIVLSFVVIAVLPTAIVGGDLLALSASKLPGLGEAALAIAIGSLFLIAFVHAATIAIGSGSAWLAVDGILLVSVSLLVRHAAVRLWDFGAAPIAVALLALLATAFFAALLGAGVLQISIGRADIRRGHRAISLTLCSVLLPAALAAEAYSAWFVAPGPTDLVTIHRVVPAPRGSWVALTGRARHRAGMEADFLVDTASSRFVRPGLLGATTGALSFSADGRRAAWPEFQGRAGRSPVEVVTLRLDDPKAEPVPTSITLPSYLASILLSDDGELLAVIHDGNLSIDRISTGRMVASVKFAKNSKGNAKALFVGPGRVRVYWFEPSAAEGDTTSVSILEFDGATRKLTTVGRIDRIHSTARFFLQLNPAADRLLVMEPPRRKTTLWDARSGAFLAALGVSGRAEAREAGFLNDGRIVVAESDKGGARLRVFTPDGAEDREIRLSDGGTALLGGETAPGILAVAIRPGAHRTWEDDLSDTRLLRVDVSTGESRESARGATPLRTLYGVGIAPVMPAAPGVEASKLFRGAGTSLLLRIDPTTGERRTIIQTGARAGS